MDAKKRIIFAPAITSKDELFSYLTIFKNYATIIKLGLNALMTCDSPFELIFKKTDFQVMLDFGFNDISATVAKTIKRLAEKYDSNRIFGLTVDCSTGEKTLKKIVHEINNLSLRVIGITVRQSLKQKDLDKLGYACSLKELSSRRARIASNVGISTLLCAPWETKNALLINPVFEIINHSVVFSKITGNSASPRTAVLNGASYIILKTTSKKRLAIANAKRAVAEIEEGLRQLR